MGMGIHLAVKANSRSCMYTKLEGLWMIFCVSILVSLHQVQAHADSELLVYIGFI